MAKAEATEQPEYDPIDALETPTQEEGQPEAKSSTYGAKSRDDLEKMLDDQKSMIGRQSNEVADVRREIEAMKGAKSYVDSQLQVDQPKAKEIDYFGDPASAIKQSIEDHPALKQQQEELSRLRAEGAAREIEARHPDASAVLNADDFKNYIAQSPSRTVSYSAGMKSMDVGIMDELLSAYKSINQPTPEVEALKNQDRKAQVRKAATGNAQGSSETSAGKTISRDDIVNLKMNDPDRYRRLYPQIEKMYREGRVK